MSERASSNSTLYFLTGALVVAVLVIGYFAIGRSGDQGGGAGAATSATVEDTGTNFKLEVGKNGGVSGSVEKK